MPAEQEFRLLMRRMLKRSNSAAQEVLRRYEPLLLHVIRKSLPAAMRSKFDSLDFSQDVWASFLADPPETVTFDRPDQLAAYLAKIAQNKVAEAVRQRLQLQKHNVKREQSLDDSREFDKEQLIAQQRSPSEIMMSQEEWEKFLEKQPLVYRRVYIEFRSGKGPTQIGRELGINERTVRRVLSKLKSEFAP